jgi:hypothetical protein
MSDKSVWDRQSRDICRLRQSLRLDIAASVQVSF